ncbi:MAG: hypothetical protein JWN50_267 [Parcubacteria group bacterium]|nr:hypothetical protein [Parcubacteria group bacterium]
MKRTWKQINVLSKAITRLGKEDPHENPPPHGNPADRFDEVGDVARHLDNLLKSIRVRLGDEKVPEETELTDGEAKSFDLLRDKLVKIYRNDQELKDL